MSRRIAVCSAPRGAEPELGRFIVVVTIITSKACYPFEIAVKRALGVRSVP
jgi:hypothetical protein